MTHCVNVGITHWGESRNSGESELERSEFFFAPAHIQKRMQDWGPAGFAQRTSTFMADTIGKSRGWLKLTSLDGLGALAANYSDICGGRIAPDTGLIVKM